MNLQGKPFYLDEKQENWVRNTLETMTAEQKIGQLFCVLGDASEPAALKELVKDYGIGGVLFRPDSLEKIQKKYSKLDEYAKIPLLKAANLEEGGAGVLTDGIYYGSQMEVAAADDLTCTKNFARVCAAEGRKAGVNWTFSPVVDIGYNFRNPITNVRTFGSNPEKVLANASAFVEEIQKYGIAASCKHFPGDGVDFRDQHLHPTYNDLSADEWFSTYGKIYETLIRQQPVKLHKCVSINEKAIANAEYVIEGEIVPGVKVVEDQNSHTGYAMPEFPGYNGKASHECWLIRVKAVTTRKNPIMQTVIGPSEEHVNLAGIPTEASIYNMIEKALPGKVTNVYAHPSGGGKYMAVLQCRKKVHTDEGKQRQAALLAFSAFPGSMKTVAGIASGYSDNLLLRAADVTLKERRKLVLVARETPFNTVHLRNLYELSQIGAVIMPPMLTYYNKPETLEECTRYMAERILRQFGLGDADYEWKGI